MSALNSQPFWIVWCDDGGTPTFKHSARESAEREAERLARLHHKAFHVLQVVGTVRRVDVEWDRSYEMLDMPF